MITRGALGTSIPWTEHIEVYTEPGGSQTTVWWSDGHYVKSETHTVFGWVTFFHERSMRQPWPD